MAKVPQEVPLFPYGAPIPAELRHPAFFFATPRGGLHRGRIRV
jgi:hypothetical protein